MSIGYYGFSLAGISHIKSNTSCQDANGVLALENGWFVAVVADGLGSCSRAQEGSELAVKTVLQHIGSIGNEPFDTKMLQNAFDAAVIAIAALAAQMNEPIQDYHTTLTAALYNGNELLFCHCGDGGLLALDAQGNIELCTEIQKGEFLNSTMVLMDKSCWQVGHLFGVRSILLVTDGVLEWAFSRSLQKVNEAFVRGFMDLNYTGARTQAQMERTKQEIYDYFSTTGREFISDDITVLGVANS